MNTSARPAEGAKDQDQRQKQKQKPNQKIAAFGSSYLGLVYTRPSPLNRSSVSSPAFDFDLLAPSAGRA
jgi:hypothetical protein